MTEELNLVPRNRCSERNNYNQQVKRKTVTPAMNCTFIVCVVLLLASQTCAEGKWNRQCNVNIRCVFYRRNFNC